MWPERVVGPLTFIDQPAQMVGAVGRLVDATNVPVPAADDIVPAPLSIAELRPDGLNLRGIANTPSPFPTATENGAAFERDYVRLANQADSPELREKLLNLAREWMHAVMDVEDAASAKEGQWSKAPKQRSSGGSDLLMSTEPN